MQFSWAVMLYSSKYEQYKKGISDLMQLQFLEQWKKSFSPAFSLKCGAIFGLFLLSILVAACGSSSTSATNPGDPPVTATINMDGNSGSPTPPLQPYWCGAWATQTTPPFGTATVGVYAKFTQNVNGNPQGVDGATAAATVQWPDGAQSEVTGTTSTDGLVVLAVSTANRADAVNKITLVTVSFAKDGVPPCNVPQDRAAFFTLVIGTAATGSPITSTGTTTNPGATPTVGGIPPGPPTAVIPGPTPKPTKTPRPRP